MNLLIGKALAAVDGATAKAGDAATGALAPKPSATALADANTAIAEAPSAGEALGLNLLLIAILVGMFYILLIIPQQKRFKKHREMINAMKKGDKVLTSGGLIGVVDKIEKDSEEIVVDLGSGLKVTALRSTIQSYVKEKKPAAKDDKKPANKDEPAGEDDKKSAKK
jgi:preprotein translocase subunit YajC